MKNLPLTLDVFLFGDFSELELYLQLEELLFDRAGIGVFILRDLGQGAKHKFQPGYGKKQQVGYQEHKAKPRAWNQRDANRARAAAASGVCSENGMRAMHGYIWT